MGIIAIQGGGLPLNTADAQFFVAPEGSISVDEAITFIANNVCEKTFRWVLVEPIHSAAQLIPVTQPGAPTAPATIARLTPDASVRYTVALQTYHHGFLEHTYTFTFVAGIGGIGDMARYATVAQMQALLPPTGFAALFFDTENANRMCSIDHSGVVTVLPQQGAAGANGTNGTNGTNGVNGVNGADAFSTVAAPGFTMPAISSTAAVVAATPLPWAVGMPIYVHGAGHLVVATVTDSTHATLRNDGAVGNATQGTVVAAGAVLCPAGATGATGDAGQAGQPGQAGASSFSTLSAGFTMPYVAETVAVVSTSTMPWVVNLPVYVQGAGQFIVTAVADSTHATLRNDGAVGNALPGDAIASGALVFHAGTGQTYAELDYYKPFYDGADFWLSAKETVLGAVATAAENTGNVSVVQATAANRPTCRLNHGGKRVIRFDGVAGVVPGSPADEINLAATNGDLSASTSFTFVVTLSREIDWNSTSVILDTGATRITLRGDGSVYADGAEHSSSGCRTGTSVLTFRFNATTSRVTCWQNGTQILDAAWTPAALGKPIRIGSYETPAGDNFKGDIFEILRFPFVLTDDQVRAYAARGLSIAGVDDGHAVDVQVFGDSISVAARWPSKLRLGSRISVTSNAVGGHTIEDSTAIFDTFGPQRTTALSFSPMRTGSNDLVGTETSAQILARYWALCDLAARRGYGVIADTITPRLGLSAPRETIRQEINAGIRANWQSHAIALADTAAIPELLDPSNSVYYSDGVHPTPLGDELISVRQRASIVRANSIRPRGTKLQASSLCDVLFDLNPDISTTVDQVAGLPIVWQVAPNGVSKSASYGGHNSIDVTNSAWALTGTFAAIAQPVWYFFVGHTATVSDCEAFDGGGAGYRQCLLWSSTQMYLVSSALVATGLNGASTPRVWTAEFNNTASHCYRGATKTAALAPGNQSVTRWAIGAAFSAGMPWRGWITRMLVVRAGRGGVSNDAQQQSIMKYLASEYSVVAT